MNQIIASFALIVILSKLSKMDGDKPLQDLSRSFSVFNAIRDSLSIPLERLRVT